MKSKRMPLAQVESCPSCGQIEGHHEECILAEHQAMLGGEALAQALHDPEDCYWCLHSLPPVQSACRCGDCCRHKIVEVELADAEYEPAIRERASPIIAPPDEHGRRELIGYLHNSKATNGACVFLDQATNLCTIYATRPLVCRLFSCDKQES